MSANALTLALFVLGLAMAVSAHLARGEAERRARQRYREIMGSQGAKKSPLDFWQEMRPIAGGWGCLVPALEFLRGLGLVVAVGSGLYWALGR